MQSSDIDPAALGFTVIVLNIALEEAGRHEEARHHPPFSQQRQRVDVVVGVAVVEGDRERTVAPPPTASRRETAQPRPAKTSICSPKCSGVTQSAHGSTSGAATRWYISTPRAGRARRLARRAIWPGLGRRIGRRRLRCPRPARPAP